jgi:hypothetical protein
MECEALVVKTWPIFEKVCRHSGVSPSEMPEIEPIFWETIYQLYQRQAEMRSVDAYCYRSLQHALYRFLKTRQRQRSMEVRLEACTPLY